MSTIDINTRCWHYISPDSVSGPCVCAQRKDYSRDWGGKSNGIKAVFLLLNNLQTLYERWGNGSFQGISTKAWGRRRMGWSETPCSLASVPFTWMALDPRAQPLLQVAGWASTWCLQQHSFLGSRLMKPPPRGITRGITRIFRGKRHN